jgi:UTP--glucose-1-phosphate uridylyltransferase
MNINKAVITAAGKGQRTLPLQSLIDRDGVEKSVLSIIIEEVLRAGVEEICLVIHPGDEKAYLEVAGDHASRLHFVGQPEPLGYGHAVYCARPFTGEEPFLHLVGDHLYVSRDGAGCARRLVQVAEAEDCAVSAVQATREHLLPYYGAVGGRRLPEQPGLYRIEQVIEKPTPTKAEQQLMVPGLRAGHYLCFFGMHVLTTAVFDILEAQVAEAGERGGVWLGPALNELARREQYLALEMADRRYDVGVKYGLLTAQMALALSGQDRDLVLTRLLELLAER